MNLRKDHSHALSYHHCEFSVWTFVQGWRLHRYPCAKVQRRLGRMGACHLLSVLAVTLPFFILIYCGWKCLVTSIFFYNFQRSMSRLEQRWRAQRTVISIVNCRIPWTNRNLNVNCAFGISLKACLLQCPIHFMPATWSTLVVLLPVCFCVLKSLSAFDTFKTWGNPSGAQQIMHHWCCLFVLPVGTLLVCIPILFQDMKSGQQTRWI